MTSRDSRVDPIYLDVVVSPKGRKRCVEFVTSGGTVIYSGPNGRRERQCDLKTWRRWAKEGKVVYEAPGHSAPIKLEVTFSREISRELLAWRNRVLLDKASDADALMALAEVGLSFLYGSWQCRDEQLLQAYEKHLSRKTE